LNNKNTQKFI